MKKINIIVKGVAIAMALAVPNKLLEGKTYDAELTGGIAQMLDTKYANDTTEAGKEWRVISVKENITANDVYDFLMKYWNARGYVEDICPTCVLGLAEAIRQSNLVGDNGNGKKITIGGPEEKPQTQTKPNEVSEEAKDFFKVTIEVGEKKMSALEYLIKCGYLPEEIDSIYKKIKSDWGNEKVKLGQDLLNSYALHVTGRVLPYPSEQKQELTDTQRDSLRSWALDTLCKAFEKSLGPGAKLWRVYYKNGDTSLDGIYHFCIDVIGNVGKGTKEEKAVKEVINVIWPYTEEWKRLRKEMER